MTPIEIIRAELARIDAQIAPLERERALLVKLAQRINGADAGITAAETREPAPVTATTSQRGVLVRLIRQTVANAGRDGVAIDAITEAVQQARPETTRSTLAASLSALKRRGEMRRTRDGLWRME